MELTLAGGVVIDLATTADLKHHHERLERMLPKSVEAEWEMKSAAAAVPAVPSRPLLLDFGAPPAGRLWLVQYVVLFGNDALSSSAAIANVVAAIYSGRVIVPDAIVPSAIPSDHGRVLQPGLVVPSSTNLPDRSFVRAQDHLYALITGSGLLAGAANYHGVAGCLKADDTPEILAQL